MRCPFLFRGMKFGSVTRTGLAFTAGGVIGEALAAAAIPAQLLPEWLGNIVDLFNAKLSPELTESEGVRFNARRAAVPRI